MKTITLFNGDCLEVLKTIPNHSIDLILTDPPYGTTDCKWDNVIPFEAMWAELNRVIKPGKAIVLFGAEPFSSALRVSNRKGYKYDWIWKKKTSTGFLNANKQPLRILENIMVFNSKVYYPQGLLPCTHSRKARVINTPIYAQYKSKADYKQKFTNYPVNLLEFPKDPVHLHPTQKPVALLKYLIRTYAKPGETVLDFTMGSGSTGVACIETGNPFVGIELGLHEFSIAEARLCEALRRFKN